MSHFVYIINSQSSDKFYTGETCCINERIKQHNSSFFTQSFSSQAKDWTLFWFLKCVNREQALRIERHIKKMKSRKYFENLKIYPEIGAKLLTQYS